MSIPVVSWIDEIIKQSFKNVFDGINKSSDEYLKSKDIFNKGQKIYSDFISDRFGFIQILGMSETIKLDQVYVKLRVTIQRKL